MWTWSFAQIFPGYVKDAGKIVPIYFPIAAEVCPPFRFVFCFLLYQDFGTYVHRIGRTARNDRPGVGGYNADAGWLGLILISRSSFFGAFFWSLATSPFI